MNSMEVQNPRCKMQVALLAEPKTPRQSSVSIQYYEQYTIHVHTMRTAIFTRRYPLHMRVKVYCAREITSVVYGRNAENEPVRL